MKRIVLFANAWGSHRGGINAFNADLCTALSQVVRPDTEIVCVLLGPAVAAADICNRWRDEAAKVGVRIESIVLPDDRCLPPASLLDQLKQRDDLAGGLYIGHDIFTGPCAVNLGNAFGASSLVINHMATFLYKPLKDAYGDDIWPEITKQEELFRGATYVGGVGPRLYEYARSSLPDCASGKVFEIIPGMPELQTGTPPRRSLNGITVGRISPKDDIIKRGRLATKAFGRAIHEIKDEVPGYDFTFQAIGLSSEDDLYRKESDLLARELMEHADVAVAFHGHRFNEDRERIYEALRRHDVFFMLSLHEGFGLAGLEAIAAGVPLILSRRSGLHDYLEGRGLDTHVGGVWLCGDDSDDMRQVVEKTLALLRDRNGARARARTLLQELRSGRHNGSDISWTSCASRILQACGCENLLREPLRPSLLPSIERRKSSPWTGLSDEEEFASRGVLAWFLGQDRRFLVLTGVKNERQDHVVERLMDVIRWDAEALYQARVERVSSSPTSSVVERLAALSKDREGRERSGRPTVLVVLDAPTDAAENPSFWPTLVQAVVSADFFVLMTTSVEEGILPSAMVTRIAWPTNLGEGGQVGASRPTPQDLGVDVAAGQLVARSVLGLTSDELFDLLGDFSQEERFDLIARLQGQSVSDIMGSEGRWVARQPAMTACDGATARRLADYLEPTLEATIGAAHARQWDALRRMLASALEGVIQRGRAGEPDRAFLQFRDHLLKPTLFRYARFDLVLTVLSSFFADREFQTPRFVNRELDASARKAAAQAMANLGSAREAFQLLRPLVDPASDGSILLAAAFCAFLAGAYGMTEAWLAQMLRAGAVQAKGIAPVQIATAHRSVAKLYIRELRLDEAQHHLETARQGYQRLDDLQGLAAVDAYQAELDLARGRPDTALRHADRGLARLSQLGELSSARWDARDRLRLLLTRARTLRRLSATGASEDAAKAAMLSAVQVGALDLFIEAHILSMPSPTEARTVEECEQVLESLASQAERSGLRRHHAELVLALARMRSDRHGQGAAELARQAHELAELDGGVHRDAWLQLRSKELQGP